MATMLAKVCGLVCERVLSDLLDLFGCFATLIVLVGAPKVAPVNHKIEKGITIPSKRIPFVKSSC